jgi:peroxiredoxin
MLSTHPAAVPKLHPKHTAVADISRLLKKRQKENVHLTPALNTALLLRKIGTRHPLPYHALMNIETPAPDFTLYATDGETITLSEQTGTPTVLVFFPAAFTGVCETEVCTFRDAMTAFNDIGATVYGISVDSRFALAAFAAKNDLNFTLLSDYNRTATDAYGIRFAGLAGMDGYDVANRSVFVIDATGNLAWQWVAESLGDEPPYNEVQTAVSQLTAGT